MMPIVYRLQFEFYDNYTADMTCDLRILKNAIYTSLSDGVLCYYTGEDGLGVAPSHRLTTRGSQQDGDTDLGFRLDPRIFTLILETVSNTRPVMESKRASLSNLFLPTQNDIVLEWTYSNGSKRVIDCVQAGDAIFASSDRLLYNQKLAVTFRAQNPLFYDPIQKSQIIAGGVQSEGFTVPMGVPFSVGVSSFDTVKQVNNQGNWNTPLTILAIGPWEDLIITNETTGDTLDFSGYSIATGDYITIETGFGRTSVLEDDGTNRVSWLSDDSDLTTFSLQPGVNNISVEAISTSSVSQVVFYWFNRFANL